MTGVGYKSLEVSERSSVDNLMKEGPDGACFWWTKLLLFEFKLIHKELLESLVRDVPMRDHSLSMSYHWIF